MNAKRKRIGILTGGGDVPGLNSVIKSVTYRGWENGLEVIGIRRGFEGLTHVDLDDPASRSRYASDRKSFARLGMVRSPRPSS